MRWCEFSELIGKTILSVEGLECGSDSISFNCSDGSVYVMYHAKNCCERVSVDDIDGDAVDITGVPVSLAEESSDRFGDEYSRSTWTFYRLAARGYMTIKWLGTSNGYYSESVDFACTREPDSAQQ